MKILTLFFCIIGIISCTLALHSSSVPLEVYSNDPGEYLANLNIIVDGKIKKVRLDTGARTSSLVADKDTNQYPVVKKSNSKVMTGKSVPVEIIKPRNIKIASQSIFNPEIAIGHRSLLGLDLLEKSIFQIDLKNQSLNFLKIMPKASVITSIKRLKRGHIVVPINMNDHTLSAIFDTGASITVVDLEIIKKYPKSFRLQTTNEGVDGHDNKIQSQLYLCSHLKIGPLDLKNIKVVAFTFDDLVKSRMEGTRIILGNNIIHEAIWTFNLPSEELGIDKN